MSQTGYPPVYVVDTHATTPPPVPPRQSRTQRRSGAVQTLLILLVSLALCGMVIEGCLIYRLYRPESAATGSPSKMISDISPPPEKPHDVLPSKPTAHLTDGLDGGCNGKVLVWSTDAYPILHEIDYDDEGHLIILQEGHYYIYSKVFFSSDKPFLHEVHWKTKRYRGESITLLASRETESSSRDERSAHKSNSFLGGVFHFYKGDAIFVKVNNCSQVVRFRSYENFFGAYMI